MAAFSSSPYTSFFLLLNLCSVHMLLRLPYASSTKSDSITLASVRNSLIRQEDTIIFCLIERARFPINSNSYTSSFFLNGSSILSFYVKHIEAIQSKVELPCFLFLFYEQTENIGILDIDHLIYHLNSKCIGIK